MNSNNIELNNSPFAKSDRIRKRKKYESFIWDEKKPRMYYGLVKYDYEKKVEIYGSAVPSVSEQKSEVLDILKGAEKIEKGTIWCIIEKRWYESWKCHVRLDKPKLSEPGGPPPGPINNEPLIENAEEFKIAAGKGRIPLVKLKYPLLEKIDFIMVPRRVWDLLFGWYGGLHFGFAPTIARATYSQQEDAANPVYSVDLYPLFIDCAIFDKKRHQFSKFRFSRGLSLRQVKRILNFEWSVPRRDMNEARLWIGFLGTPWKLLSEETIKIKDLVDDALKNKQLIVEGRSTGCHFELDNYLENEKVQGKTIESIRPFSGYYSSSSGYDRLSSRSRSRNYLNLQENSGEGPASVPGVCGLRNLGNTCFMNSALQCLTKTRCFREYFTEGMYTKDVNRENPLGMNGDVASSFGELMKLMWSGKYSVISPRHFKYTIGRYNHTFAGYHQQDSHELIAFLLDGIHEDLNRVVNKPQTRVVEARGRPDEIVANECWEVHRKRNNSIIVEKFQGQLKSEVVCPNCKNVSITFDPYMYLSVPVPGVREKKIPVTVMYSKNRKVGMKILVVLAKGVGLTIADLRREISRMSEIPVNKLLICDIWSRKVYRIYRDHQKISLIQVGTDHVFAYETEKELLDSSKKLKGHYLYPFGFTKIKIHDETEDPIDMDDIDNNEEEENKDNDFEMDSNRDNSFQSFQKQSYSGRLKSSSSYNYNYNYRDNSSSYYNSYSYGSRYEKDFVDIPFILDVKNKVSNGHQIYEQVFIILKSFLKPEARDVLFRKSKGRIDLNRPETCFPKGSESLKAKWGNENRMASSCSSNNEDSEEDYKSSSDCEIDSKGSNVQNFRKYGINKKPKLSSDIPSFEESLENSKKLGKSSNYEDCGINKINKEKTINFVDDENIKQQQHVKSSKRFNGLAKNSNLEEVSETDRDLLNDQKMVDEECSNEVSSPTGQDSGYSSGDDIFTMELKENEEKKEKIEKIEKIEKMKDEDEDTDDWVDGDESEYRTEQKKTKTEQKKKKKKFKRITTDSEDEDKDEKEEEKEKEIREENFGEPRIWKKYLFTVSYISEINSLSRTTYSSRNSVQLYDAVEQIIGLTPYRSSFIGSGPEEFVADVRVLFSDYIDESLIDKSKFEEFEEHQSVIDSRKKRKRSDVSLPLCIEKFCEREKLTKDNAWYCRKCKNHVEAEKKFDIWRLPQVLVFQLKRFSSGRYGFRQKIDKYIHYPFELDMEPFTINKENRFKKYKLYAVSNHYGGLGGGHYTAYATAPSISSGENGNDQSWYDFDDSSARRINRDTSQSKNGYVLFYEAVVEGKKEFEKMKDEETVKVEPMDTENEEEAAQIGNLEQVNSSDVINLNNNVEQSVDPLLQKPTTDYDGENKMVDEN